MKIDEADEDCHHENQIGAVTIIFWFMNCIRQEICVTLPYTKKLALTIFVEQAQGLENSDIIQQASFWLAGISKQVNTRLSDAVIGSFKTLVISNL